MNFFKRELLKALHLKDVYKRMEFQAQVLAELKLIEENPLGAVRPDTLEILGKAH